MGRRTGFGIRDIVHAADQGVRIYDRMSGWPRGMGLTHQVGLSSALLDCCLAKYSRKMGVEEVVLNEGRSVSTGLIKGMASF